MYIALLLVGILWTLLHFRFILPLVGSRYGEMPSEVMAKIQSLSPGKRFVMGIWFLVSWVGVGLAVGIMLSFVILGLTGGVKSSGGTVALIFSAGGSLLVGVVCGLLSLGRFWFVSVK